MKRKLTACLCAVLLLGSVLEGCGSTTSAPAADTGSQTEASDQNEDVQSTNVQNEEEVEIVMYIIGDKPAGQDVADENLNNILKDKLNCTLKINWIPWADYVNKYPLLFSSGEEFDMAYTATWLNFNSLAQRGAFMPLEEIWPSYAPDNYAAASDEAKAQATVKGHIYCIPTQLATYSAYGVIYRTDIMEGTDWNGKMETFEDMEAYCDIVKETHPEIEPIDVSAAAGSLIDIIYFGSLGYRGAASTSVNEFLLFDPTEDKPEVLAYYEIDETKEFLEMMNRWNEKGFFGKSALADTDSTKTINGKAALAVHNVDNYQTMAINHPEWNFKYSNYIKHLSHLPYTQDAVVLSNTSRHPERALALWNLITTDQEVYDALMYGILGTTYELNEEGQYSITDNNLYAVNNCWAARTTELNRNIAGSPKEYDEYKESFEEEIKADNSSEKYASFVFDTSEIETEYAACLSVNMQYWWPLELGYTDPVSGLAEYQEKMEAAGIEKVREELQHQIDEYLSSLQ